MTRTQIIGGLTIILGIGILGVVLLLDKIGKVNKRISEVEFRDDGRWR